MISLGTILPKMGKWSVGHISHKDFQQKWNNQTGTCHCYSIVVYFAPLSFTEQLNINIFVDFAALLCPQYRNGYILFPEQAICIFLEVGQTISFWYVLFGTLSKYDILLIPGQEWLVLLWCSKSKSKITTCMIVDASYYSLIKFQLLY